MEIRPDRRGHDDQLLELTLCPSLSLQAIADASGMTLTQLARWAAQDHIREALRSLRTLHRARAAVIAAESAATALSTLDAMVRTHEHEERSELPPQGPQARAVRARTRETIRKACHQLLRAAAAVAPGLPVAPGFRPEHRAPARSNHPPRPTPAAHSTDAATAPPINPAAPAPRTILPVLNVQTFALNNRRTPAALANSAGTIPPGSAPPPDPSSPLCLAPESRPWLTLRSPLRSLGGLRTP